MESWRDEHKQALKVEIQEPSPRRPCAFSSTVHRHSMTYERAAVPAISDTSE